MLQTGILYIFFYQETQMGRNWIKFIQICHCVLLYCFSAMLSFIWQQITYWMTVGYKDLYFNDAAHWQIVLFIQETNSSKSATVSRYTAWALCSLLYGIIPFSGRSLVGVLQDPRCSLSFPHFIFPTPAIRIKVSSVLWQSSYVWTIAQLSCTLISNLFGRLNFFCL